MEIRSSLSSAAQPPPFVPVAPRAEAAVAPGPMPTDSTTLGGPSAKAPSDIHLRILHMNDIHGAVEPVSDPAISTESRVGGLAAAKAVIDRERGQAPKATLALNAGDLAEGSMVAYLTKGEVVGEALHEFGFDAIEPGNHDFVWGRGSLSHLLTQIDAPVVGANIVNGADGTSMEGTSPYLMREVNGVRVAIIGLDTPDMERFVDRSRLEGLKFQNAADTVRKLMPEVRAKGADLVVALSHLGFDEDRKLAHEVEGLDVIVGGHSHTELPKGHVEGSTIIVQAGSQGKYIGELDLTLDALTRQVRTFEARLVPVLEKEVTPDPRVASIVNRYVVEAEATASRVMGQASEDLHYSHKDASKLNQINADSLLAAAPQADIAISSSRNLRGNLPAGDVSFKDLFAAYPMTEEDAVTLKTTGRMLKAELEDRIADGGRGIAVPAGFSYAYDPARPNLDRVTQMRLADGRPLDLDREYTVATTITTARKKTFAAAQDLKIVGPSQKIFMDFFRAGSPWHDDPDPRVVRAGG